MYVIQTDRIATRVARDLVRDMKAFLNRPMDISVLTDETLLRYYEDIREHVSADIRSGGHHFLGQAAKERADILLTEIRRRGLSITPIYWPA
jgi:hypothetical protein